MRLVVSSVVLGLAWFIAINLLTSAVAWIAARVVLRASVQRPEGLLLAIRLLPAFVASFVVLVLFVPGHVRFEPRTIDEPLGILLPILSLGSVLLLARSAGRFASIAGAAASLRHVATKRLDGGSDVYEVSGLAGISVAGVLHARIIVGERAHAALSPAELEVALAHEAAHLAWRDNLKRCAMYCAPDFFGLTATAQRLEERWRAEAECRADAAAAQEDRGRALHLASALIKVARLAKPGAPALDCPAWSTFHEPGLLEVRVRRLVAGSFAARGTSGGYRAALMALALPGPLWAIGAPYHLHRLTEALVALVP